MATVELAARDRPGQVVRRWWSFEERLPIPPPAQGTVWWHQGGHYDHPRHRHAALELNLVVRGRGHYEVAGRAHPLAAGTALFIAPGQDHFLEERSDDFEMWILALEPPLLERTCDGAGGRAFLEGIARGDCARVLAADDARWLAREVRRFADATSIDFRHAGLAYAFEGTREAFARARSAPREGALSPAVRRCLDLLDDEPALSREELAERGGASPDALSAAFRRELGVGLVDYRNRLRVRRFVELAAPGRLNLLGACLDAGFGSYAQFHRVFVAETGLTPRAYLAREAHEAREVRRSAVSAPPPSQPRLRGP